MENNCLPAAFAIHNALKDELSIENRIGATFGKVYCGVVGGIRRHEFAVMGAPVNLAARLMASKVNKGLLVDEAVREQCSDTCRFLFKELPPVDAKGYDKPVPILEPVNSEAKVSKRKKSTYPIVGRKVETRAIMDIALQLVDKQPDVRSWMVFLTGESGMGKTALALAIIDDLNKKDVSHKRAIVMTAKSSSTETEQRIPLR